MLNKMLTYVKVLTFTFGVKDFMEQIKQYNAIVPIGMTCATASQLKKRNLRWERIIIKFIVICINGLNVMVYYGLDMMINLICTRIDDCDSIVRLIDEWLM